MACFTYIHTVHTLSVCWCLHTHAGEAAFHLDATISRNMHHLTLCYEMQKKEKKRQ